ncbi:TetR/AcrR family transcriptional regulator [Rothia sp. HC945]|uniref:TetR/AcrR family transcriptional regulator n=1 Tax=Rothia sp. HC945 TaxID=3171170 RepID=UPI00264BB767|nr:TetR/AcrR family transcriptional regulator [Kocuria sp.]MDN5616878.1 TetR/AcrR family transcriptional regulator [Kocuria sp.]MDN5653621.1 TetR/AcrR family transcriptional regulator [Kocuria sp.]
MSTSTLPGGDRRHARREATRKAILEAAESIVLEEGVEALKSKSLAERAGISQRSLFNHFPNLNEVVLSRITSYLTVLLSEPEIPSGLPTSEIPDALDWKFKASFDRPEADHLFNSFLALSLRLDTEMVDLLGRHVVLTLADVSSQIMESTTKNYPDLDFGQNIRIRMYISNLTNGIAFGLLRGINRLGVLDSPACGAPEHDGAHFPKSFQGTDALGLLNLESLREDIDWAFEQVAIGRPRI